MYANRYAKWSKENKDSVPLSKCLEGALYKFWLINWKEDCLEETIKQALHVNIPSCMSTLPAAHVNTPSCTCQHSQLQMSILPAAHINNCPSMHNTDSQTHHNKPVFFLITEHWQQCLFYKTSLSSSICITVYQSLCIVLNKEHHSDNYYYQQQQYKLPN